MSLRDRLSPTARKGSLHSPSRPAGRPSPSTVITTLEPLLQPPRSQGSRTFVCGSHSQPTHQDPSLSIYIKSNLLEALVATTGPPPLPHVLMPTLVLIGVLEPSFFPVAPWHPSFFSAYSTMSSRPRDYWGSPPFGAVSRATSLTLQGGWSTSPTE